MLKAIMEAAKRGDLEGLEGHVLAVLAQNEALHQTIEEQTQTLARLISKINTSIGDL